MKANEANFQPALADLREVAAKLNKTFDPDTQAALKTGLDRFSSAANRLDAGLAQLDPVLKDLGAPVNHAPSTDIGQAVRRINVLAADLELLTSKLRDGRGGLNTDGTIQKLLTQAELHDNFNNVALSASQTLAQLRAVLADLRVFAEKVAQDPSAIGRCAAIALAPSSADRGLSPGIEPPALIRRTVSPRRKTSLPANFMHRRARLRNEPAREITSTCPGSSTFRTSSRTSACSCSELTDHQVVAGPRTHSTNSGRFGKYRTVFRISQAAPRAGTELSTSRRTASCDSDQAMGNECVARGDFRALEPAARRSDSWRSSRSWISPE